ncbi:hypothetical protein K502DRAFT_37002 [Neoconidiobolus thromboides FSU 785]|nr:hypothetical protein K502DRAFT_37002 [Neoconidiobolus thromboides FSU 785]
MSPESMLFLNEFTRYDKSDGLLYITQKITLLNNTFDELKAHSKLGIYYQSYIKGDKIEDDMLLDSNDEEALLNYKGSLVPKNRDLDMAFIYFFSQEKYGIGAQVFERISPNNSKIKKPIIVELGNLYHAILLVYRCIPSDIIESPNKLLFNEIENYFERQDDLIKIKMSLIILFKAISFFQHCSHLMPRIVTCLKQLKGYGFLYLLSGSVFSLIMLHKDFHLIGAYEDFGIFSLLFTVPKEFYFYQVNPETSQKVNYQYFSRIYV